MKYLIIGAGATGGCLAAFMTLGGLDVSVIDQGETLDAIRENGITVETNFRGTMHVDLKNVYSYEEYDGRPDVVILCVKEYSINCILPFLKKSFNPGTIILPLINVYGTGLRLQKELPQYNVLDGFTYIIAHTEKPGYIMMYENLFSIVFGVRDQDNYTRYLDKLSYDLRMCDIEANVSDEILCDSMRKFSFISPVCSCGAYYGCTIGEMQEKGEKRDMAMSLMKEIESLADALGFKFSDDIVSNNFALLDRIKPHALTSLQHDIASGQQSEIDGILFNVVRMADEIGIDLPNYRKVASALEGKY